MFKCPRRYNISPANPVRKKCDQFEELFLKKWQDNAEALESAGKTTAVLI